MEVSFKWQKILLMHFFGLATKSEIEEIVHRFDIREYDKLVDSIQSELYKKEENIFIVTVVPIMHQYNLPNYIITSPDDLHGLYRNFAFIQKK